MDYLNAFLCGGILCAIGQILIDKTPLTPARILTGYVVCGVLLTAIGVYEPIVKWGGAGATVPLLGFGYSLAKGVEKAVQEQGWLGVMTGGLSATAVVNIGAAIANATSGGSMAVLAVSVLQTLMSLYLTLFVLGAITTVTEWKNIRCAAWKKVLYAFTFPLFMLTYVPICIASLFTKVEWKPICHTRVMTLEQIEEPGLRAS